MKTFSVLIFVAFFIATNLMDKAESVKVKLELKTFDEIFGEGWWDKGEAEDLKTPAPTNFGQNVHHQIDRQNTQIGQIELGQIEPNSTDQNPLPLSETDHSDNAKNDEEQNEITSNENIAEDARKHKIIDKFQAIKDEFKQKGKYSKKEWNQIEEKIAKHLKVNRQIIYKWKKEFGLSRKVLYEKEERKHLIEKFDQRKAELTRAGFKNSYHNEINEIVAKVLGLSFRTIYNWKRELGQIRTIYSDDEKLQIVKKLMQMESAHSGEDKKSCKEIDKQIAERFGVNVGTIRQWKKEFGRSQKVFYEKEKRKHLVEKFDQMKDELKRDGFKNSYKNELDKTVAKKLGLNYVTIYRWKRKLGQITPNKYSHSEQKELMKRYYEIKDKNPKMSVGDIAKIMKIGSGTLYKWKKQFKRQQFHPNSVDGHSVEANIENSNSGSI